MARRTVDERIANEKARRTKLDARLKALQAQSAKAERAKDARRKVLLGTLIMAELDADGPFADTLKRWLADQLPSSLSRDTDRELMARFLGDEPPNSQRPVPSKDTEAE